MNTEIEIKPCGRCEFCLRGFKDSCIVVAQHTCDSCGEHQAIAFDEDVVDGDDGAPERAPRICPTCADPCAACDEKLATVQVADGVRLCVGCATKRHCRVCGTTHDTMQQPLESEYQVASELDPNVEQYTFVCGRCARMEAA